MVRSMSALVWAVERNMASNCDGGIFIPRSIIAVEKFGELRRVGGASLVGVAHALGTEEHRQQRSGAIDASRLSGFFQCVAKSGFEARAGGVECGVRIGLLENAKCLETRANGKRISRQRARLVDRTDWREQVHDLRGAGDCADRHSAADYFSEHDEVRRRCPCFRQLRAETEAEPGYNFVTDQKRAVVVCDFGERFQRSWHQDSPRPCWRRRARRSRQRFSQARRGINLRLSQSSYMAQPSSSRRAPTELRALSG